MDSRVSIADLTFVLYSLAKCYCGDLTRYHSSYPLYTVLVVPPTPGTVKASIAGNHRGYNEWEGGL